MKDLLDFLEVDAGAAAEPADRIVFAGTERELPAEIRELLVRLYAPEIDRLADLLDVDLAHWLDQT